jgi:Na+/H+ antiporter NhaD/arsenite permease-like protein
MRRPLESTLRLLANFRLRCLVAATALALLNPSMANAADAAVAPEVGRTLGLVWGVPFAGLLLSIALLPLFAPRIWHRHYGKIAASWGLAFVLGFGVRYGPGAAAHAVAHAVLLEYLPFIALLGALYTVAGGVRLTGVLRGTPTVNLLLLLGGTVAASVIGTTGAAMLLVRPLIRANRRRRHKRHVFVFMIFLVANVGGALSPLGDPPLFLGFLEGVPFFWPTRHLLFPTLFASTVLLLLFYALDLYHHRRAPGPDPSALAEVEKLGVQGKRNLLLLPAILAIVLMSGMWQPSIAVTMLGVAMPVQQLLALVLLVVVIALSLRLTKPVIHAENEFTWDAMREVAVLFAAIFVTIVPMLAILHAGEAGSAAQIMPLLDSGGVPNDRAYFWATGLLSAVLDNAPTYLIFFHAAGGEPAELIGRLSSTLQAISAGAVFFGALTYIGNAPNLMVRAIAESSGIKMPGFFGYIGWAAAILLPVFAAVSVIYL